MYYAVNLLAWIAIIVGVYIIHKKVKKKVLGVAVLILAVLACCALSLKVNTSVWFDTPSDVAKYLSNGKMIAAIEGQDTCCIIIEQSSVNHKFCLLGKESNRHRILTASEWTSGEVEADDGMRVSLMSANGTPDGYAYGTFFEPVGSEILITDTNGTVFTTTTLETAGSENVILAYAYVGPIGDDYGVHVTYTS